jgi:hypothetical protein
VVKKEEVAAEGATGPGVQVKAEPDTQGGVLGPGSDVPMPDAATNTNPAGAAAGSQQEAGASQPGGPQPMSVEGSDPNFRLTVPKSEVPQPVIQLVASHAEFLRSMGECATR